METASSFILPSSTAVTTVSQNLAITPATSVRIGGVYAPGGDSRVRLSVMVADPHNSNVTTLFSLEISTLDAQLLRGMLDETLSALAHAELRYREIEEQKSESLASLFAGAIETPETTEVPPATDQPMTIEEGIEQDQTLRKMFGGQAAEPVLQ